MRKTAFLLSAILAGLVGGIAGTGTMSIAARNGSGTYSLPSGNPVSSGTTISSTWANNTLSDIATALTDSVARDGQSPATANLPMGGFRHTNVDDAAARTDYARADQVQDSTLSYLTSVAGTNTITATAAVSMSAYAAGQKFHFIPANTTTDAATININSIGAKNIYYDGAALVGGELKQNVPATIVYDGTQFNITSPLFSGATTLKKVGGYAYLQTNTISGAATSSFDNLLTSSYDTYVLKVEGLVVASDQEDISILLGTGSGPTYQTSSYQYSKIGMGLSAAVSTETQEASSDNVTSRIVLTRVNGNAGAVGNAAGESFSGEVVIHKPSSSSIYKHITWTGVYTDSLGRINNYSGGGMWKSTTAVTSVRLLTGSGGNMTGSATLYGLAK